jgi:threonine/homoserine/homoserine lactone efflux protein
MDLFAFLLAVLLLELTPGPNMAYLATLALSPRGSPLVQSPSADVVTMTAMDEP